MKRFIMKIRLPNQHISRPSRPIRRDVWIVERMRFPTDRPTDQRTQPVVEVFSHLKRKLESLCSTLFSLTKNLVYMTIEAQMWEK